MITCHLQGGLGNQIFQIFATISYAIKNKTKFNFLNVKSHGGGSTVLRYTFWETFFSRLKLFLISKFPQVYVIKENEFSFNELPILKIKQDLLLYGYFQSYKYFQQDYEIICRVIGIEKMKNTLLTKINLETNFFEDTVSIHFRIGDYKNLQDYHPITPYIYYETALKYIQSNTDREKKYNVIYFCENVDIDEVLIMVKRLEEEFLNYKFIRCDETLADWEQLLFMSCCHHNIIANSSFSWWGGYFNLWKDKIVCYPAVWFGENIKHKTKDLCPEEWIKIY